MREQELLRRLGRQIRTYRKAAGLSQQELGERVGLTYESVSKLERGVNFTSLGMLFEIGRALNRDLPELFSWAPRRKLSVDEEQAEKAAEKARAIASTDQLTNLDDIEELMRLLNRKRQRPSKRGERP